MKDKKGKEKREIKKVVMIFSMSFQPYQGRYLRVFNQARSLLRAHKEVTIIAWDRDCKYPKEEMVEGIKVERIWSKAGFQKGPSNLFSFLVFYFRLIPLLLKKEMDLAHCFNLDTLIPGLLVAKIRGKKTILDLCEPNYYNNWPKRYLSFVKIIQMLERVLSKRFDYVLVHSLYQVRKFQRYGIKSLEHIGSYPNSSFIQKEIKKGSSNNRIVIGRLGSIYKNNGIEEMLEAFKRLVIISPNVRLLLGGKVFKEFEKEFQALVSHYSESVEITGEYNPSDLKKLYKKIDISLQLSRRNEWFKDITPTKFFESLAMGIPVVTSDIGDLREIIERYRCGIIVDETNPNAILEALLKLASDPQLRLEMAKNGLTAIKEEYNWNLMGKRLLRVYKELEFS